MTPGERAARKAARELFACLSNGEEHITPSQLERKMRKIYNLQKKRRRRQTEEDDDQNEENENKEKIKSNSYVNVPRNHYRSNYDNNCSNRDVITEANLVTAAVNYSHGLLPAVNNMVMTVSAPHPNSLDHVPCFHRLIFHPVIFFTIFYHRFVNLIASFPSRADSNLKLLMIALVYTLFSSDNSISLLPLIVYYISFGIMIWSTFKMLKTKHDFIDFQIWSGLFLSYGDNVDTNASENQFLRNNMKPYLLYFCAFITNLIIYPVINDDWLPYSEITLVSFILVFVTMLAFMYTSQKSFPDFLILISFGVNVLAKYPYEMDSVVITGWRFLDLKFPTFGSFVIGNGIEFCLNCRAVLYLLIPGILLRLAKRSNWHGTYTYLIPHCVTLSWLQMCIISSQSATMFGLIRAALGLSGILLFLPLFGIITLMIPIFVAIEWLGLTDPNTRKLSTVIAVILAIIGSCFMAINHRTQKYITTLQVIICIIALTILTIPYMTSNFVTISHHHHNTKDSSLYVSGIVIPHDHDDVSSQQEMQQNHQNLISWETFHHYCGEPAWVKSSNKIRTQLLCSQLEGANIKWEGMVENIEIIKTTNVRAWFIEKFLPKWIGNLIKCYYGEENKINCSETLTNEQCDEIRNYIFENKKCNLNKWNTYEYEIKIRIHSGILSKPNEIYLKASHQFGNFTKNLHHFDRISFSGKLLNIKQINIDNNKQHDYIHMVLGSDKPVIDLNEIQCLSCQNKDLKSLKISNIDDDDDGKGKGSSSSSREKLIVNARLRDLTRGIKYFLNVLFNPILTFK